MGGGVISWEPLPDRDCRGMWGLTTRNLIVTEKVMRLPTPGTRISADSVPTCSAQVIVPSSGFAHLQNQGAGAVRPEDSPGTGLPDLGPQTKGFAGPGAWSAHAQAES